MNKNIVIGLLIVIVLVLGYIALKPNDMTITPSTTQTSLNNTPTESSSPATTTVIKTQVQNPVVSTTPQNNCTPSISLLSPAGGESYTVGQKVTITWKSCGVKNVYLSLGNGGKDMGLISGETPIPASQNSYVWTATSSWVTQGINTGYAIHIEGADSNDRNVQDVSGTFNIR